MTDAELRDQAVRELTSTKLTYTAWVRLGRPVGAWSRAFAALAQIGGSSPGLSGVYHGCYIDGATMGRIYGPAYAYTVPDDPATVTQSRWELDAGKSLAVIHRGTGSASTPFWDSSADEMTGWFQEANRRGAYPLLDASTAAVPLGDIAAGKYDAKATAWFTKMAAYGRPWFFRLNTEMNWHNYPYARVPAQGTDAQQLANFIASWRHLHDLAGAVGANDCCSWHWAPNARPPWELTVPFEVYYPGDAYVDWTGAVIYQQSQTQSDGDWSYLSAPSYAACLAAAPGKPIMVSEWSSFFEFTQPPRAGAGTDASKGQWLRHALEYVRDHQPAIRAMVMFNTGYLTGKQEQNQIESSAAATAGYRAGVTDPVFLGRQAALATSGKVPVPVRTAVAS